MFENEQISLSRILRLFNIIFIYKSRAVQSQTDLISSTTNNTINLTLLVPSVIKTGAKFGILAAKIQNHLPPSPPKKGREEIRERGFLWFAEREVLNHFYISLSFLGVVLKFVYCLEIYKTRRVISPCLKNLGKPWLTMV